ncbi:MAG: glycosyltransferase family A protein, partial [Paludibacteraceae bacterium]|nr:glycosyltransferase family A protein [Paludibacteraceae bacterium]
MRVSVIVPVYNSEKYIAEALDSILASDYADIEVVCVDDGSKDASLQILNEYALRDSRVRVYSQQNAGACAARNYAISLAKGEFILPVDSDNKITSTFISRAMAVMLSDTDVKVVAPRAEYFGDKEGEWKLPPFSLNLLARKNI